MHSCNNKNNQHGYYLLYHNITVSNVLQPPPRFWTLLTVWKAVVSHSSVCWRVSNIFWFPMKKAGNVEPPDNDAWRIWNKLLFWMFFWFIDVDKKTIGLSFLSHLSILHNISIHFVDFHYDVTTCIFFSDQLYGFSRRC